MQLGWIDFSREDREKVLDVINLLQEPGAVDEIGIGVVRDAFANIFFPGTSTVQTGAKYFLIVPYILKEATDGRYRNYDLRKILQKIDDEEKSCGIRLMHNCPGEEGIIGRRVLPQKWVARKPSSIYWNGIRTYGICTLDISIPELVKASIVLHANNQFTNWGNKGDTADSDCDDADAGADLSTHFFNIPDDYYKDWRTSLTIDLTLSEAEFLRKMIEASVPDTLMGYLLKNNVDVAKYTSFEALYEDIGLSVPAELNRLMKLACEFNRLVYTAHVRYNYILFNGQNDDAVEEWTYIEKNMQYMMAVDVDDVLKTLRISNPNLRSFLRSFKNALLAGDLAAADQVLINREINIKTRNRAKLCKREDYSDYKWVGGRYLDFRFSSAKRILLDIYHGEEVSHV